MKKPNETECALWEAYIKNVTPLGQPCPSQEKQVVLIKSDTPNRMDLHGMTMDEAFIATKNFLAEISKELRHATIITGLSGQIKREFPLWIEHDKNIRKIESMNGGGAYRIVFKRKGKTS